LLSTGHKGKRKRVVPMTETGILFMLCILGVVAFGVTRVSAGGGYSRGSVLAMAALAVVASVALLLFSFSHTPILEASGILHD
jgi:hypothetical protein